jgi:hypothetical protein
MKKGKVVEMPKKTGNIKVTNGEAVNLVNNPAFRNRQLPVKARYWLGTHIADKLRKIVDAVSNERAKIIEDLCVKDEKGAPKIEKGRYVFDPPEKELEADKAVKELYEIENTLPWPRVVVDIGQLNDSFDMTASDMDACRPLIEFTMKEGK